MPELTALKRSEMEELYSTEKVKYERFKAAGLNLDLTRGKPAPAQLRMITELGMDLALSEADYLAADGSDIRNYGHLYGLPEARDFFSDILGVPAKQLMVLNNSSLSLMYDFFTRAMLFPLPGSKKSWSEIDKIKVLCPSPGYDRHFAIAEAFGCELIPVTMLADGPDMDQVEALVQDDAVKAMFCVPIYTNPEGVVYSEEVCRRLAAMPAAGDFRIIWDNAYFLHHLDWNNQARIPEVISLSESMGNPNRFFVFASTSKITYAGSGLACLGSSVDDFAWVDASLKLQTIGPDKISQRRHLNFFRRNGGIEAIMKRHADLLKPKFDLVLNILEEAFRDNDLASWRIPGGGYFISLDLQEGQAKSVVAMAKELGVALTPAGSTFPRKHDPLDRNIRLAPTFPDLSDLEQAMKVVVNCVKLNALETMLNK